MTQTGARIRISTITLRLLAGVLLALGVFATTFAVSSAQNGPGDSGWGGWDDNGDWRDDDDGDWGDGDYGDRDWDDDDNWGDGEKPSLNDLCNELFSSGVGTGNAHAGSIDCSVLLGGGYPPHDHGDKDHDDKDHGDKDHGDKDHGDKDHGDKDHGDKDHGDKDHGDKDHGDKKHDDKKHGDKKHDDKKHEEKKEHEAVGGKEEVKVTSLPSTGYGQDSASNVTTAGIFATLALAFASLAGITLRLSGTRVTRR